MKEKGSGRRARRMGMDVIPRSRKLDLQFRPRVVPRAFKVIGDEIYEIAAVLDQWYQPYATYFKVQTVEGKTYLLRYDEETDEWTLQSGFDGDELLARSSIDLVTVDS